MGKKKECQICGKILSSKTALNTHLKKKIPCKPKEKIKEEIKEEIKEVIQEDEPIQEVIQEVTQEVTQEQIIINPISEQEKNNIEIMEQIHMDISNIKWEKLDKYTFDFFDPHARSMLVVGSSFCGKSTFVFKVADMMFNNNKTMTLCLLDNPQADIYNTLPRSYQIEDTFRADLIKNMHTINKKTKNRFKFAVISDDLLDLRYSTILRSMLLSWRNSRISSIVCLQALSLVSLSMRNSISYFCFRNNTDLSVVETIMKHYLGGRDIFFKKKSMLEKIMLYQEILKDKSKTIVMDNIQGKLRYIEYKL